MSSYGKLCTESYDLDKPEAPAEALAFYLRYVERVAGLAPSPYPLPPGERGSAAGPAPSPHPLPQGEMGSAFGPVLEPMCGSGRFLVPLLERGLAVEGVDSSAAMLDACRRRCGARGVAAVLYRQAIQDMSLPRQYGLAFIPTRSFILVADPAEARQALGRVYAALLPGATFVVEIDTVHARSKTRAGGREVARPDGGVIKLSWQVSDTADANCLRCVNRYELWRDGRLEEEEFEEMDLRLYERQEFEALLTAAGFEAVQAWALHEQRPPDPAAKSIVFECRKPEGQ